MFDDKAPFVNNLQYTVDDTSILSHITMKTKNTDENIQMLETELDVSSTINYLVESKIQEECFYIIDVKDIINKYIIWNTLMPRIKPFYAVKCNPNPMVLKVLATLGTSFDCASKSEIKTVLNLGVKPNCIIYAHTIKLPSHIAYAASVNVNYTTFDCETELLKCKKLYPNVQLLLRIKCDSSTSCIKLGSKFGCHAYKEAPKLLRLAKSLDLNVVGVAFHVGFGCQNPSAYHKAVVASRHVFNCADSLGFKLNLLDIGGGFPGNQGSFINEFAEIINISLEEYFPDPSIKVIAEPGTYFVRSAFTLACNIFSTKAKPSVDTLTNKTRTKYMYYIDDGVYGSFSRVIHTENVTPQPLKNCNNEKLYSSTVWGPTCDSIDRVADDVLLPKLEIGDWLMFENMGDYSTSIATTFNGFFSPKKYAIADRDTWLYLENKNQGLFKGLKHSIEHL